jgi:hypothetical protein
LEQSGGEGYNRLEGIFFDEKDGTLYNSEKDRRREMI